MSLVLILFGLLIGVLLASLAEAIRGLDPETLALPEALEEDEAPLLEVTERFKAAEAHLRAGAVMALGGAAFLTGRMTAAPGATLGLVILTGLMGVVLGLLLPDSLVHGREAAVLGRSTRLVLFLAALLRPATAIQSWLASLLAALFGTAEPATPAREPTGPTAGPPAGALETVLSFANSTVVEVMTPRAEMVVLESGARIEWVTQLVKTTRHGRYPVYRGTLDEMIGAVDIHDLLRAERPDDIVDPLVDELQVVPESKRCWELALEMQSRRYPMALVIDEFGAVSGLVTQSDLLAELVGEIAEEGEPAPDEFRRLDLNTWELNPFMKIDRVNELTGLGLPDGDYLTLAGFILTQLGRIPAPRERLHWGEGELEILAANQRRIESVRLRMGKSRRRASGAGERKI